MGCHTQDSGRATHVHSTPFAPVGETEIAPFSHLATKAARIALLDRSPP